MVGIMRLRLDICYEDEALAVKNIQRRCSFGYIHLENITDEISIVLFTDNSLKWYQNIIKHDYPFTHATSSLFRDVKFYKRLLYNAVTLRHSFPGKPPLLVTEYITSNHSKDSLIFFISHVNKQVCLINAFVLITYFSKDHFTRF